MTQWQAMVAPLLGTVDLPGMCLRFAQSFFGAPAQHRSAWHAWQVQKHRFGPEVPWPDVPVLLWFEHWGKYDDGLGPYDGRPVGARGNWGHVAVNVPGDAIYTSPLSGTSAGQERYANISQMAARMNLVYVGFSLDINGLLIAEPVNTARPIRKDSRMHAVRQIGLLDSGVIVGGGQPPRARTNSVFVAECAALGITPVDCPGWQYGTVVREAWTDFNTSARLIADAVAGKVKVGGTAPIGLSPDDAAKIAKAVNDEAAKRMKE